MFGFNTTNQSDNSSNIFQSHLMTNNRQNENKIIFGGSSIFHQSVFVTRNSDESAKSQHQPITCSVGFQPLNSSLFYNIRNKEQSGHLFSQATQSSTTTFLANSFQSTNIQNNLNTFPNHELNANISQPNISSSWLNNNDIQTMSKIDNITSSHLYSQSNTQVPCVFSQSDFPSNNCMEISKTQQLILSNSEMIDLDNATIYNLNNNVSNANVLIESEFNEGKQSNQQESTSHFLNNTNISNNKKESRQPSLIFMSPLQTIKEVGSSDKNEDNKILGIKRQLSNNVNEYSSLVVREIPLQYLNNELLSHHFSKFGHVSKIYLNKKSNSANVHFKDHESAKRAKENGEIIDLSSSPMKIFWRAEKGVAKVTNKLATAITAPVREKRSCNDPVRNIGLPLEHYNSLKSLTNLVAENASERFELLEQKDKILKSLNYMKQNNLSEAVIVEGTCMDMCPEKERYMRQDRRRLTIYEIIPGTDLPGQNAQVDHSRAVKEYSRSSADQDMPLPEELRPVEVLNRTMDYLLNYIIDTGNEETWSEWYNFLWDRMRSIRKDITQQQLCNKVVVSLVEKSARFHIICSQLLCEEDISVFDMKINDENLTKCLQTLKELYNDLASKNIVCENEAEFAAYKILMNLNEGDIIYEAQQWSSEILKSEKVQQSLQIYGAINSNNYIRFFRLATAADYITSSILHRYFTQMRAIALQRIIKSYSTFRDPSLLPLEDLVTMLRFDSNMEASNFISYFGLGIHSNSLMIDKNKFVLPEAAIPAKKSLKLVESKRNCLLSEAINGSPLADFNLQIATSSFDKQNHLTSDFINSFYPVNRMHEALSQINNNQINPINLSQFSGSSLNQDQLINPNHSIQNNVPPNQMQEFFQKNQFNNVSSFNQNKTYANDLQTSLNKNYNPFEQVQINFHSSQSKTNTLLNQVQINNPFFQAGIKAVISQVANTNIGFKTQLNDNSQSNKITSNNQFNIIATDTFNPSSPLQAPRYENTTGVNLFSGFQVIKKDENSTVALKPQLEINAEVLKALAKDLFLEVISELCLRLGQEVLENFHRKLLFIKFISDGYIVEDINDFIKEICQEMFDCALILKKKTK